MPRNTETKHSFKEPSEMKKYFEEPNLGLRSYFGIVRDGQPEVYYGPFADVKSRKDVQRVLQEWSKELVSIENEWPTLLEFENDMRAKVGPMSHMLGYKYRIKDIEEYYTAIHQPHINPVSDEAIAQVQKEWAQMRGLRIRQQDRTVANMRLSTNSGSPYFTKRNKVVSKTLPVHTWATESERVRLMQHGNSYLATAILGWRGQEGGPGYNDTKQRVVWMFPFGVNLAELQVYQPMIESAQKLNLVPAWVSMEAVDANITKMFDTKPANDLVVCTDFTAFDQHFNSSLQDAAFKILEHILAKDRQSSEWLREVYPIKYVIPLCVQYGVFYYGRHGMASGSGGTNADETLAHRALQYEAALKSGKQLNPYSQCLGDDGILTYPSITVDDVIDTYTSHGLDMNESKQYVSKEDCTYLRRWHHTGYRRDGICVGVYSTMRALGRLMYQERYYDPDDWGPKMVALRQLSIMENVKWHPLAEQFATFCMKRDRYRLGLDIPGFLDSLEKQVQYANDRMPDFIGYTKSQMKDKGLGINDWWIVKYLKSQR